MFQAYNFILSLHWPTKQTVTCVFISIRLNLRLDIVTAVHSRFSLQKVRHKTVCFLIPLIYHLPTTVLLLVFSAGTGLFFTVFGKIPGFRGASSGGLFKNLKVK